MRKFRRAFAYALIATAVSAASITSASAACAIAGTWHVFLLQSQTPDIRTEQKTVKAHPTGTTSITVFASTGDQFDNHTAVAMQCKLVLTSTGRFTADKCDTHGIVPGDGGQATVSGRLIFGASSTSACPITGGTINVVEDPTPVDILGGYVNGDTGAGIARQGPGSVFLFNIVKQ